MNGLNAITTRRDFVRLMALAPLAVPVSAQAFEPVKRAGGAFLKPALNYISFREQLDENKRDARRGIDMFGVCDFCARQNIDAMDVIGYFFPEYPQVPTNEFISRFKRYAHARGVVINGTGIRNDFATADKSVRRAGVQLTKEWIETASRLGASMIRIFAGPQSPFKDWRVAAGGATRDDVEKWMADDLRTCAEYGEKFGVVVGVQNHGDFIATGVEHISLLRRVDHPYCGAAIDTGRYLTDDPYQDIAMVVPYAVGWQIKDNLGSSPKLPALDFRRLMKIIHDGGYRGFLAIETLGLGRADYNPALEVETMLKAMRDGIAATNS